MKVAFILERLGNGGAERVTAALSTELSYKNNYEVHVFTCIKEKDEYKLPDNVVRHVMKSGNSRLNIFLNKCEYLVKEVNLINPDIVFSLATPKTTIMLTFLSIWRKFTLIVSERNDPVQYPKNYILKILRAYAYLLADGVVFQTESAKKYFCSSIQSKGCVIPNPISADLIEPYKGIRTKKIVNFCRLEPQKNLKLLIDAMIKIHVKYPDFFLEIYGDGSQKKELLNYCTKQGADKYVKFRGFASNVHERILDASIYVSSSNYEGISNSMLEAIALGIPTIATDCPAGGAKMVIQNYDNGILVPVGDLKIMVKAIEELIVNKELSKKISHNGIKLRNKFSTKKITKKWLGFAERIRNDRIN